MTKISFRILALLTLIHCIIPTLGQSARVWHIGQQTGVPQSQITDVLQDEDGYIWMASRDGLVRFDGYRAQTFKDVPGDNVVLPSNRVRRIFIDSDSNLVCNIENRFFIFDRSTLTFGNLDRQPERVASYQHFNQSIIDSIGCLPEYRDTKYRLLHRDRQGGLWVASQRGLDRVQFAPNPPQPHPTGNSINEIVRAIAVIDSDTLAANKLGEIMRIGSDLAPYQWLDSTGIWRYTPATFGRNAYVLYRQPRSSALWIGTRHHGLFRLDNGNLIQAAIPGAASVYTLATDSRGRLYAGCYDGGVYVIDNPASAHPKAREIKGFQAVRHLEITNGDILLAASDNGLYTLNIYGDGVVHHSDLPDGTNAVMDICCTPEGNCWLATYGGGIARIDSQSLDSDNLSMTMFTAEKHGLASNVCVAIESIGSGRYIIAGEHALTVFNEATGSFEAHYNGFGSGDFSFSEGKPISTDGRHVLLGTSSGLLDYDAGSAESRPTFVPQIVFSCPDTVILSPDEHGLNISFSTLDFDRVENIRYAYKVEGVDEEWRYTDDNRLHFANLPAGTFSLLVRSTDGNGVWLNNERRLTITRHAHFTETRWFYVLIGALLLLSLYFGWRGFKIIRMLKREISQMSIEKGELSEYYNARLRDLLHRTPNSNADCTATPSDTDLFKQRVDSLLEQHYADPNFDIDSLGSELAMSRTKLYREIKNVFGSTPNTMLQNYRLHKATEMLRAGGKTVSEVAYGCGWSDPKYFSRVFKKATGASPSSFIKE